MPRGQLGHHFPGTNDQGQCLECDQNANNEIKLATTQKEVRVALISQQKAMQLH